MNHSAKRFRGNFAAAFIPRINGDGGVEVLVIGSLSTQYQNSSRELQLHRLQVKMPGGCAVNREEDKDSSLTIARELRDEIARNPRTFRTQIGQRIFQRLKKNMISGNPNGHRQSFYHAQFSGDLRIEDMMEEEGDETLSPPIWVELRTLLRVIFFSHKDPLMTGLAYIAKDYPKVAGRYADIIANHQAGLP